VWIKSAPRPFGCDNLKHPPALKPADVLILCLYSGLKQSTFSLSPFHPYDTTSYSVNIKKTATADKKYAFLARGLKKIKQTDKV
jgi:hypothetical protein